MIRLLRRAVEEALGPVAALEEPSGGHAGTARARVWLADGSAVFAKLATRPETAGALRAEWLVCRLGRSWHPGVVAYREARRPLLVLEDLAGARWPPPWPTDLGDLWEILEEVDRVPPPEGLAELEDHPDPWGWIAAHPDRVAALGVADRGWIADHAGMLSTAARRVSVEGDDLVHADLGTGNVCFASRGPVLVDWEHAARGSRRLDAATLSVDLVAEGRPPAPGLPDAGGWASLLAAVAGRAAVAPPPPGAVAGEELRRTQRRSFAAALEWACQELGCEPPGSANGGLVASGPSSGGG